MHLLKLNLYHYQFSQPTGRQTHGYLKGEGVGGG